MECGGRAERRRRFGRSGATGGRTGPALFSQGQPRASGASESGVGAPLCRRTPNVPASLLAVVRKAMALDAAARYPSVEDLQADVLAYQNGFATGAENAGAWKQFALFLRRHKAASLATAVALVLLVGVSSAFTLKVIGEPNRAEQALADLSRSAPLYAAEARALIEKQQFTEALVKATSAIAYRPEEAEYHLLKGDLLESLLRLPEARDAYAAAIARRPTYPGGNAAGAVGPPQRGSRQVAGAAARYAVERLEGDGRKDHRPVALARHEHAAKTEPRQLPRPRPLAAGRPAAEVGRSL